MSRGSKMEKNALKNLLEKTGLERYDIETLNLVYRNALRHFAPPSGNPGDAHFYVTGREQIFEKNLQESAARLVGAGYIARTPGHVMDHPMELTKKGILGFGKLLEVQNSENVGGK